MFYIKVTLIGLFAVISSLAVGLCAERSIGNSGQQVAPTGGKPPTLIILEFSNEKEGDNPNLFPRNVSQDPQGKLPGNWRQEIESLCNGTLIPENFDPKDVPQLFRRIYQKCKSSGNSVLSDEEITQCLVEEVMKKLPGKPYVKAATRAVVSDLLNKHGQRFYTSKSLLGASAHCQDLIHQSKQSNASVEELFSKCFFNSLIQMHPLKEYAVAALRTRVGGFFESVAKACHDSMPKDLVSRREINRYYLQCFIDGSTARYKDTLLVKYGRRWLTQYIDHPDSVFNREKIIDIAELCDDKTQGLPPEKKIPAAFSCFFRSILALHPRTKRLADYLIRWEATLGKDAAGGTRTPEKKPESSPSSGQIGRTRTPEKKPEPSPSSGQIGRTRTPEKKPESPPSSGQIGRTRSIIPMLSKSGANSPQPINRETITECMLKAVTQLPVAGQAVSTLTNMASRFPKVGGLFGRALPSVPSGLGNAMSPGALKPFVDAATPCFQLFKRDESGKLVLDTAFAMGAATEVIKLNPMGALAIGAAEALADNVTVTDDEAGKPQYNVNYQGLGKALAMAALKSTKLGRMAGRFKR